LVERFLSNRSRPGRASVLKQDARRADEVSALPRAPVLIGFFLLLAFAAVPLAGGRLGLLADVRIRLGWLAVAALLVQVVIVSVVPGGSHGLHVAVHLATYVAVAAVVAANLRLPYAWLMAAGGAMNFAAIVANAGVMPASASALRAADRAPQAGEFANSVVRDHPHLAFLGDVFAVPAPLPLANVFSVGDVCLVAGAFLFLHAACRVSERPRAPRRGRRAGGRATDAAGAMARR
jgi:Family of unknown function (DUF5317)